MPDVDGRLPASALLSVLPEYLTFVLSFVVGGVVWMSHHRKLRVIRGCRRGSPGCRAV